MDVMSRESNVYVDGGKDRQWSHHSFGRRRRRRRRNCCAGAINPITSKFTLLFDKHKHHTLYHDDPSCCLPFGLPRLLGFGLCSRAR